MEEGHFKPVLNRSQSGRYMVRYHGNDFWHLITENADHGMHDVCNGFNAAEHRGVLQVLRLLVIIVHSLCYNSVVSVCPITQRNELLLSGLIQILGFSLPPANKLHLRSQTIQATCNRGLFGDLQRSEGIK